VDGWLQYSSRQLLGDAASELEEFSDWIIVPHGFLGYLPFEVLLSEEPPDSNNIDLAQLPYLLRKKSLRYAPSASFLAFLARQGWQSKGWQKDALLLGDPLYTKERLERDGLLTRSSFGARSFERLRKTREEVAAIASLLIGDQESHLFLELRDLARNGLVRGSRFDLYVGSEVTEARVRGDLRGYRLLHLATHGYFDPEYPWFSGLVLSDTKESHEGSRFLNMLDLGRCNSTPSSCSSRPVRRARESCYAPRVSLVLRARF
jgi:hypothetical protein